MRAMLVPAALAIVLVVSAVVGPRLIRMAAPMLIRVPRAAAAALVAAIGFWVLAVASLSLMLAWMVTGPSILPTAAANVCQRCLDAARPFDTPGAIDTAIPAALLLLLPTVGALSAAVIGIRRALGTRRRTQALSREVLMRARPRTIDGHSVLLLDDERPIAFSLPRRSGGIVVSTGLLITLGPDELAAVLAHESEHLHGRHHLVLAIVDILTAPVQWVPFARAIASAIPHYLEIVADDAARRQTGTPALASALLKLGDPDLILAAAHPHDVAASVLHAAGPDRIGHLVRPPRLRPALLPGLALGLLVTAFTAAAVAVHGPYLSAILTGCGLPTA